MESSRRDLLNDMAKHRPILKNNQNTHLALVSHLKQVQYFPKRGFVFTVMGIKMRMMQRRWNSINERQ